MVAPKPAVPPSEPLTTDAPRRRLSEPVAPYSEDLSFGAPPTPSERPAGAGDGFGLGPLSVSQKLAAWGLARRTLGICLLLLTVCLWTVSNFLASVSLGLSF